MRLTPFLILFQLTFFVFNLYAQPVNLKRCLTDKLLEEQFQLDPTLARRMAEQDAAYREYIMSGNVNRNADEGCEVYIIPVVVHVIYNDEDSNISDEQIESQMAILNQDYRRVYDTPAYGAGVDMKIQFCLATRDPDGNETKGITRTESGLSEHNSANDQALKNLIRWDTERYLNIWVVKEISSGGNNTLGYTYIPGTVPRTRDGVVVSSKYVGTIGTVTAPYNQGRTTTHEVGHFLGLHHTFRSEGQCRDTSISNCLMVGDRVCDTPAEQDAKYFCPDESNSCVEYPCDLPDPIRNFLNYVDDACMDEFTEGQRQRAFFFLGDYRKQLVSAPNLVATGCMDMPIRKTVPEIRFSAKGRATCEGNRIEFIDESVGCVENWVWQFPGGSPAQSTEQHPVISYATPGWYDVSLSISNDSAGANMTHTRYIYVPQAATTNSFSHSFETGTLIPAGWQIEDEDGQGSWLLTTLSSSNGLGAALMRNFQLNSACTSDHLISSSIDLSQIGSTRLSFDYAYKLRDESSSTQDQLVVELSTDCGYSYPHILFDKRGRGLATVSGTSPDQAYIPSSKNDWKNISLDLNAFSGQPHVRIRFRNIGRAGQQLYLDNIELSSTVNLEDELRASLRIIPNPFEEELAIELNLSQSTSLDISLSDLSGRRVSRPYSMRLSAGQQLLPISDMISKLTPGMYFLRLETAGGVIIKKIVKQ